MAHRKKVLFKYIILGDSGCVRYTLCWWLDRCDVLQTGGSDSDSDSDSSSMTP
jgi:hypothetical protein